jgi:hypothetical protein
VSNRLSGNTGNIIFKKQPVITNVLTISKDIAMQYNNEECVDILKRLITANKDRIDHYTQTIELLNKDVDADLIMLFEELTQQSQQFAAVATV